MFSLKDKFKYSVMLVLLVGIGLLYKIFVFSDKSQKQNKESRYIFYDIYPRGSKNDTWLHKIAKTPLLRGTIYESKVFNRSRHTISYWNIEITIRKPCYISSCWNGKVEIHQKIKGKTIIQSPICLRDEDPSKLVVENFHARSMPTLIPLSPGDKVIYHPDDNYSEGIIAPADDTGSHFTNIGFIFYKNAEDETTDFNFADSRIIYHMVNGIYENAMLYVATTLLLIWIFSLVLIIRLRNLKNADARTRMHDQETIEQVMTVFTKFIDAKDYYTGGHSERVASISRTIARKAGYSEEDAQKIFYCGLLHDCGKISIGDSLLSKSVNYTPEEFKIIRAHTARGYELLRSLSSIPEVCETALYHHERYDGTGYPEHLEGNEIPEHARIVAVADSFDTMNSARNYRKGLARDKIISEFEENRGSQFDPKFTDILLDLIKENWI